jgi:hypothetical protein
LIAWFRFGAKVHTVDGLREYPGTGGLAHASWSTKQVGVTELVLFDGRFQGSGNGSLAYHGSKGFGPVFAGGDNEMIHAAKITNYGGSFQGVFFCSIRKSFYFCALVNHYQIIKNVEPVRNRFHYNSRFV